MKPDRLKAEAEALKDKARLEDSMYGRWRRKKRSKKGSKTYTYWMASGVRVTRCEMSIRQLQKDRC